MVVKEIDSVGLANTPNLPRDVSPCDPKPPHARNTESDLRPFDVPVRPTCPNSDRVDTPETHLLDPDASVRGIEIAYVPYAQWWTSPAAVAATLSHATGGVLESANWAKPRGTTHIYLEADTATRSRDPGRRRRSVVRGSSKTHVPSSSAAPIPGHSLASLLPTRTNHSQFQRTASSTPASWQARVLAEYRSRTSAVDETDVIATPPEAIALSIEARPSTS